MKNRHSVFLIVDQFLHKDGIPVLDPTSELPLTTQWLPIPVSKCLSGVKHIHCDNGFLFSFFDNLIATTMMERGFIRALIEESSLSLGYKSLCVAIKNIPNAASQSIGTNEYQFINHTTIAVIVSAFK
ncbi:hypothetical protein ACB098_03G149600 [Castanea mollissima]